MVDMVEAVMGALIDMAEVLPSLPLSQFCYTCYYLSKLQMVLHFCSIALSHCIKKQITTGKGIGKMIALRVKAQRDSQITNRGEIQTMSQDR